MTRVINTDGSKTLNHTGAGYVIYNRTHEQQTSSIKISHNSTVFQAEILAIREAAKAFKLLQTPEDKYIKIMSDSQAAIQALSSRLCSSRLVQQTKTELNKLGETTDRLDIAWIKAHVGHPGNEKADSLARKAEYIEDPYQYAGLRPILDIQETSEPMKKQEEQSP